MSTERCDQSKLKTGNLSTSSATSVYVSDAHWVAILDNISELKEQVQFERDIAPVEFHGQGKDEKERPALLFGYQGSISKEALLAAMPERPVVDRLVSKYFNDLDTMPREFRPLRSLNRSYSIPIDSHIRLFMCPYGNLSSTGTALDRICARTLQW